ncbi:hypothetical protein ACFLZX_05600 [Nanoarchaeota archaeon]
MGRSPLYVSYIGLFSWIGYPNSVIIEYIITSLVLTSSIVIFFRKYIGPYYSTLAALIWLPFFYTAEPPVQMLALAFSLLGLHIKITRKGHFWNAIFYTFLGIAALFRGTYFILLILFLAWDVFKLIKNSKINIRPIFKYWPVLIILSLYLLFSINQTNHQWNNADISTMTWFPYDGKSLSEGGVIHNYNWNYILQKYGTCKFHDHYFTNQELFDGADNIFDAIKANPQFVITQYFKNFKFIPHQLLQLTIFSPFANSQEIIDFIKANFSINLGLFVLLLIILIILSFILYIRSKINFRILNNEYLIVFIIGTFIMHAVFLIFVHSKLRYLVAFVPIILLFTILIFDNLRNWVNLKWPKKKIIILPFLFLTLLLVFSNGLENWTRIGSNIVDSVEDNELHLLESNYFSPKSNYETINAILPKCHGVMSLEHRFIGAYTDIDLNKLYDVWEIPPFGNLTNSTYEGLRFNRINCVFASFIFEEGHGCGTNTYLRYHNYVKPYTEEMVKHGAEVHQLPKYGYAYILKE